ncbi:protein PHLOEM PROTEIN 2-LIKE A1-like [Mangifera indica]|uniref:protein PHLOEM PROTEIN 2-LIKE A1-like n=1 Tax=Mangifera indica TaxID=29780 RepID=UPI001CFB53B9|nr:protein PHLOEM PROTEIN 2-LIKE A1-like [Mangifera indica]
MAAAEETQISQTKLQLPKSYEAILEEADSQIDKSSSDKLCEQLYSGLFLNQKKKKFWVDKLTQKIFFVLFAKSLSYLKPNWIVQPISTASTSRLEEFKLQESHILMIEEVILQESNSFEVKGKFNTCNLSPLTFYKVSFLIRMEKQAQGWEDPVNLRLVHPDGREEERREMLQES